MNQVDLGGQYQFGHVKTLAQGWEYLIMPAFSIAAAAVVIYFVIGGLRYLLSGGDKEAVSKAQKMITHAIIGFVLLIVMFLILQFIPEFLGIEGFKIIK
ncbi:MAG: hypothetical protein UU67_C0057G0011 [Candidatus Daviesbacteria bacterium GW2011_GWB1_41_5]|uniref:Uncharacterized protein n=1 Tax=Candidatus Daviesbacteria bacterium GW2011_GWB1_41_5 TaxID=1618429 RepID=A0A0G0WGY4_9BACT|nr:MAG: hypothetical protein UU67_C0057G0011 [Candidatus Daviesbacteria bacterium GW2011_GWB1_41_5]